MSMRINRVLAMETGSENGMLRLVMERGKP